MTDETTQQAPPAATPEAAGPPLPVTPPATPAAEAPEWESQRKALRDEAAASRVKARDAQAKLEAVLKAAGIVADDDPVAAAQKAAGERDAAIAQVQAIQRDNAVLRLAGKHGANVEALSDSLSFQQSISAIDPAAPDFAIQVEAAIAAAVATNPAFKAAGPPLPERSGGPVGGTPTPEVAEYSEEWVHEMAKAGRSDLIVKAKQEGKLTRLLAGQS